MTNSRTFYCNGCFASQHESPLIALPGHIFLCSDCVDLAHETLHEKFDGAAGHSGRRKPAEVGADDVAAWLDEAADDIEGWGAYADNYFQKKHNLEGDVAKYRERAKQARAQLTAAEPEALRRDAARWRLVAQFMQLGDVGDDQYCLGLTVDHETLEEMVTAQAARLDGERRRLKWADIQGLEDSPKTLPPITLEEAIDAAIAVTQPAHSAGNAQTDITPEATPTTPTGDER